MQGFTFNGVHCSDMGVKLVSDGRGLGSCLDRGLIPIPSGVGAVHTGDDQEGALDLPLEILVVRDSFENLQAAKRALSNWLYTPYPAPLIFDDEPDKTYYAMINGQRDLANTLYVGNGTINMVGPNPYAVGLTRTAELAIGTTLVNNQGSAPTQPVITATFTAGGATDFKINNVTTGEVFRVVNNFAINDVLVIDGEQGGKVTLNGVLAMTKVDLSSVLFNLVSGENNLTVTKGGGGSATVSLSYKERWR